MSTVTAESVQAPEDVLAAATAPEIQDLIELVRWYRAGLPADLPLPARRALTFAVVRCYCAYSFDLGSNGAIEELARAVSL